MSRRRSSKPRAGTTKNGSGLWMCFSHSGASMPASRQSALATAATSPSSRPDRSGPSARRAPPRGSSTPRSGPRLGPPYATILGVNVADLEAEALKLDPADRARLAERLLESLETLSEEENERIWLEEAARRDADLDADPSKGRSAEDVLRDARARLA